MNNSIYRDKEMEENIMKGKTHRIFAPIFTFGVSTVVINSGLILQEPGFLAMPLIIGTSALSYLSANWPDADIHAHKPTKVILGTAKKGKDGKYYARSKKTGEIVSLTGVNRVDMKIWALFFKKIGATNHRGFKSHSPVLWFPIWLLLFAITKYLIPINIISIILQFIILGIASGFMSHLVSDMFTQSGIPILGKDFSPMTMLVPKNLKLFKASSDLYNLIFLFVAFNIVGYFFIPTIFQPIHNYIFTFLINNIKTSLSSLIGGGI